MRYLFKFKSLIHFSAIALLVCCAIIAWQAKAWGQFSLIGDNRSSNLPPLEVVRYGSIEVTWVKSPLDNQKLFQIAAPTAIDRSNLQPGRLPVELRAENIEALIWLTVRRIRGDVINKIFRPELVRQTLPASVKVITSTLNGRPVIQVKYPKTSRLLTVATVTQTDVNFYSQNPDRIVRDWQQSLQQKLGQIEYLYSPPVIRRRLGQAIAILLGIISTSIILGSIHWWLGRRLIKLQLQYEAGIEACKSATAKMQTEMQDDRSSMVEPLVNIAEETPREVEDPDLFAHQAYLEQRLSVHKSLRWLSIWLIILIWYAGIYAITTRLPILMRWSEAVASQPLQLLAVWFAVSLLLEIGKNFIQRSIDIWKDNPYITLGESQRKSLRLTTIATASQGFMTFILVLLGIVITLSLFNISAGSILAGGAVLGLAISFGTQSLIKDVVNGCLILLEDRFAVGDVIIINGMDGFVEEFNLRLTQLRNPEGQLITIPNSAIAEVRNLTRLWSRVDFTVEVAYENDPDKVLTVLEETALAMYHSPEWQDKIPNPPEILGIDRLSHAGMLIRVWIETAPLQQWLVGREYRLRVRRAFAQHNITIGRPQWIGYHASLEATDKLLNRE